MPWHGYCAAGPSPAMPGEGDWGKGPGPGRNPGDLSPRELAGLGSIRLERGVSWGWGGEWTAGFF